jgi:hypothetical protein
VAYEKNPDKVTEWLEQRYPAIAARAKREKAIVLLGRVAMTAQGGRR